MQYSAIVRAEFIPLGLTHAAFKLGGDSYEGIKEVLEQAPISPVQFFEVVVVDVGGEVCMGYFGADLFHFWDEMLAALGEVQGNERQAIILNAGFER
ncbi:hypothetical protein HG530_012546 [Fusarium avenaceum]|nr:hypothetical protein HG530_012546 [Fusarium avenaceum]